MSLRNELREAVDEVVPRAPGLEQKVQAYVFAGSAQRKVLRGRRNASPWLYRFQGAAGLIAAATVIALIAGLVVGGRVWRDLNATPSTINQHELKDLEKKPLNFPSAAPGAPCPASVEHVNQRIGMVFGDGPVYVVDGGSLDNNDWGRFGHLSLVYQWTRAGLVLMRVKDLQSTSEVAFVQYPLAPTAITVVGPLLGQVHGMDRELRLRPEAVFRDLGSTPTVKYGGEYLVLVAMPKASSGCIGLQFDGPDFSENIVVPPGYLVYL
jgi:hypothetical protein